MVRTLKPDFTFEHLTLTPSSASLFKPGGWCHNMAEQHSLAGRPPYQGPTGQQHSGPGARS